MWCSNCHQDVPGVAHAASGRLVCSQCQQPIGGRRRGTITPICDEGIELTEQVRTRKKAASPIRTDDWSIRQRARQLDRTLRRPMHFAATATKSPIGAGRFDPPQDLFEQLHRTASPTIATAEPPITSAKQLQRRNSTAGQILAWLVVMLGTTTLAAGVGLIGWSRYTNQMTHWNLALSLALGGQGALYVRLRKPRR